MQLVAEKNEGVRLQTS